MRNMAVAVLAGSILGGILSAAHAYSPALLPWVVGFMLAILAMNIRTLFAADKR